MLLEPEVLLNLNGGNTTINSTALIAFGGSSAGSLGGAGGVGSGTNMLFFVQGGAGTDGQVAGYIFTGNGGNACCGGAGGTITYSSGIAPGGGGGGAGSTVVNGGPGADGRVIIRY